MQEVTLEVEGTEWQTALDDAVRLSIPLEFRGPQPNAFGLERATARHIAYDDTICDTEQGGKFNCSQISLIPHGNGTHTESAGHVVSEAPPVGDLVDELLVPATVLTVDPVPFESTPESYMELAAPEDRVVTRAAISSRAEDLALPSGFLRALVLRTEPNGAEKRHRTFSGTNPPYLTRPAVDWLLEYGVEHLLVDLPSIDRENDEGRLVNHRAFWEVEADTPAANRRTLTELCYVPDAVPDGVYFVDIEVPDFALDAAPSRPLLYEAIPAD